VAGTLCNGRFEREASLDFAGMLLVLKKQPDAVPIEVFHDFNRALAQGFVR
jgi:hypothetical protein